MPLETRGQAAATIRAAVKVGSEASQLSPDVERQLIKAVVDVHLHLPGMFELTFVDDAGEVTQQAGFRIGTKIWVFGAAAHSSEGKLLIQGEITAIEAVCHDLSVHTVIRGYDQAHRLQRAKRSRTFVNMKDSDIARQLASDAGLTVGTIDATRTAHVHMGQVAQTDWEFLKQRAREIGYETGVAGGKFFFRKPAGTSPETRVDLHFKDDLITFLPRLSSANLPSEVEVRVWDPTQAKAVASTAAISTRGATLDDNTPPALAGTAAGAPGGAPAGGAPGGGNYGPPPRPNAAVLTDRPLAEGSAISGAADEVAAGLAEQIASTFAEAEGYAVGDPDITAGSEITVSGVPNEFSGKWVVTNARHLFDEELGGYFTRFYVSGRQERSLLGLTSVGATHGAPAQIPGLVCGIVTNVNDPDKKGRVKVALPWLSPSYESGWSRVAQVGAGVRTGMLYIPEVGDEVLVGFEFGDPRRPYVLAGLLNNNTTYDLDGEAVKATGASGSVVRRGFMSPAGNRLVFNDELPPNGTKPTVSSIVLGTKDQSLSLAIDQVNGTVTLTCDPKPPAGKAPGSLTISCGKGGTIDIKTGPGGTINVDGGANLNMKAQAAIKIESGGTVEIKGSMIKLN